MRVDGASVFELVLAPLVTALGLLAVAWTIAAVIRPGTLLPAPTVAAGLVAGAVGAAGLCMVLAGGGLRRYAGSLDLGLLLLGLAAATLVVWGAVEGRTWAIVSGALWLAARMLAGGLRREAVRDGYRPRWLSGRSFETLIATVETVLDADGREVISPARAAANTDLLLSRIEAPIQPLIRMLFAWVIEWGLPLVARRPVPFSRLGARARRQALATLIDAEGFLGRIPMLRSVPRTMKVLSCAGYYGDPAVMRAIGFVEYEGSPRSHGKDLSAHTYDDPNLPGPALTPSERVDAVVIGSGASGSVMAYELARRGLTVAVLERGRHEDPRTFRHLELDMFPRLYKDGGLQIATDNNTAIFQGATVGGSTVINNAIWLVPPKLTEVLADWRARGADVPEAKLRDAYSEIEAMLLVDQVDSSCANPGTPLFLAGGAAVGAAPDLLDNNRHECLGCGWCNYGCRYNRKTSMLVTFIPWALDRGVVVRDLVQNIRFRSEGARITGVEAEREGKRIAYDAERVILCAGAIGSSALLLENDVTAGGRVGEQFHVLGGLFVTGDMAREVNGYAGIGLTCGADLHAPAHYVLESYFAPPLAFSVRVGGWMLSHFERVERYTHFIDGGVMVGTDPAGGKITLGRTFGNRRPTPKITLEPTERNIQTLKDGLARMAEIYFAAGAERVYPSTFRYIDLTRRNYPAEIDAKIRGMDDILFGSAHPQGGNAMNSDPADGVVDEHFKVHGMEGLYVADTSVWPSNINANCQATAMAMSHYAAEQITGIPSPP
jgi:choline dehydrogenase-like flavoprotein